MVIAVSEVTEMDLDTAKWHHDSFSSEAVYGTHWLCKYTVQVVVMSSYPIDQSFPRLSGLHGSGYSDHK